MNAGRHWRATLGVAGVALFLLAALVLGQAQAGNEPKPIRELSPAELARARKLQQRRQQRISRKAIAYLWDQRLDRETGRIGKVQGRYLQALCYLALAADGSAKYAGKPGLEKVVASLRQPLADLAHTRRAQRKLFVGTSRDALMFETHAVVALAYEQLAASNLAEPRTNELYLKGAASAIAYVLDYRRRGRNYARAGGWPVNASPHNRNRPDRRCTAWQLLLLKAHTYNGQKVNSTAMKEAPNFILAAQRLAPKKTAHLEKAEKTYKNGRANYAKASRCPKMSAT